MGKHTFTAIGHKLSENSHIHVIGIAELGIAIKVSDLSPDQLAKLKAIGFKKFLDQPVIKQLIHDKLKRMDREDEDIPDPFPSELLQTVFNTHDRFEPVSVEFQSAHRSSFCERTLPPVMKASFIAEMISYIPLISASVGNSEEQLFSAARDPVKILGTIQGLLFSSFNLAIMFTTPGSESMGQTGAVFDSAFHSMWRFFTCAAKSQQQKLAALYDTCALKSKRIGSKAAITAFALTFLCSNFLLDYQQYESMEEAVQGMAPYTIFPTALIYYAMKINFYLNQINDPIYGASWVNFMYEKFNKKWAPKPHSADEAEEQKEEAPREAKDIEADDVAAALETAYTRLYKVDREFEENPEPASAAPNPANASYAQSLMSQMYSFFDRSAPSEMRAPILSQSSPSQAPRKNSFNV